MTRRSYVHEQEEGVNISSNSVHPGVIMTNILREKTAVAGTFSSLKIDFMFGKRSSLIHQNISKQLLALSMIEQKHLEGAPVMTTCN